MIKEPLSPLKYDWLLFDECLNYTMYSCFMNILFWILKSFQNIHIQLQKRLILKKKDHFESWKSWWMLMYIIFFLEILILYTLFGDFTTKFLFLEIQLSICFLRQNHNCFSRRNFVIFRHILLCFNCLFLHVLRWHSVYKLLLLKKIQKLRKFSE